jgi:hypothetical protein
MEIYDLRKVIDPHKHMPDEIKDSFFEGCRDLEYIGQNTYVSWSVGEYLNEKHFGAVDRWLLTNGFSNSDEILILCWW